MNENRSNMKSDIIQNTNFKKTHNLLPQCLTGHTVLHPMCMYASTEFHCTHMHHHEFLLFSVLVAAMLLSQVDRMHAVVGHKECCNK